VDARELWAALPARRAQPQPDALRKAVCPFLGQAAVAAVPQGVVAVALDVSLQEQRPSVRQVQPGE
jgi:hypothetical protein